MKAIIFVLSTLLLTSGFDRDMAKEVYKEVNTVRKSHKKYPMLGFSEYKRAWVDSVAKKTYDELDRTTFLGAYDQQTDWGAVHMKLDSLMEPLLGDAIIMYGRGLDDLKDRVRESTSALVISSEYDNDILTVSVYKGDKGMICVIYSQGY